MKNQGKFWVAVLLGAMFCNCSSNNKNMRLIEAAEKGNTTEVQKLISGGANINATNKEGFTPYLAASANGHLETMQLLKNAGASTDIPMDDNH